MIIHQTKDLPQQLGVRSVADLADQFPASDGNDGCSETGTICVDGGNCISLKLGAGNSGTVAFTGMLSPAPSAFQTSR